MGKIYEGDSKLNVVQVCERLGEIIDARQAHILASRFNADVHPSQKVKFAHMVLDAYKHLPSTTEQDMLVKKYAKHLMEKYMKSTAVMEGEDKAFEKLNETIISKARELTE